VASALMRGLLIGVLVATPVGPMALLAVRHTLERGFPSGLASGLGIATADGLCAGVAALGLTGVTGLLLSQARLLQVMGGVLIVGLGLRGLLSPLASRETKALAAAGLRATYVSCLGLTLANPPTILSFAALFAGAGLVTAGTAAAALVAGVFLGSAAWWLLLTGAVARARARLDLAWRWRLTRGSGAAMVLLGVLVALGAVR
jgi:putative LysE/RhtB family amino acid efflux pump